MSENGLTREISIYYGFVVLKAFPKKNTIEIRSIFDLSAGGIAQMDLQKSRYFMIGKKNVQWSENVETYNHMENKDDAHTRSRTYKSLVYGKDADKWLNIPDNSMVILVVTRGSSPIHTVMPLKQIGDEHKVPLLIDYNDLRSYIVSNQIDAVVLRGIKGRTEHCKLIDGFILTLQNDESKPRYLNVPIGFERQPYISLGRCGATLRPFTHMPFKVIKVKYTGGKSKNTWL